MGMLFFCISQESWSGMMVRWMELEYIEVTPVRVGVGNPGTLRTIVLQALGPSLLETTWTKLLD